MVEFVEIQTLFYLIAALSFAVTCTYYIMNLRNTQKNMQMTLETRRLGIMYDLMKDNIKEAPLKGFVEQLNYQWTDYEDFEKKYGTENNLDSAVKRLETWGRHNTLGSMVRKGIVDVEDLYDTMGYSTVWLWDKYKHVIEEHRRRYSGQNYLRDFEYLAGEMLKYIRVKDPSYKIPQEYDKYVQDK